MIEQPYWPYAGIGARDTPVPMLRIMTEIARALGSDGFTLRSGHAEGADQAFELGADMAYGTKEIYLPWHRFNGSTSIYQEATDQAWNIVPQFVPHWSNIKTSGIKKLHARNMHQVAGWDLNSPALFVICWTEDGKVKGGTATAIRAAQAVNIPVFNLGNMTLKEVSDGVNQIREGLDRYV